MGVCFSRSSDKQGGAGDAAAAREEEKKAKAAVAEAETLPKHLRARGRLLYEVLTSERSYYASLDTAMERYLAPLAGHAQGKTFKGLDPVSHGKLFGNMREIHAFHGRFLRAMEAALLGDNAAPAGGDAPARSPDVEVAMVDARCGLGGLFLPFMDEMAALYTDFVLNYSASITVLARLSGSAVFNEWSRRVESASRGVQPVDSYLIMPIQRTPRYELLFRELDKLTDRASGEFAADLLREQDEAGFRVREVARTINRRKRQVEAASRILALQRQVGGSVTLAEEGRLLVLDGVLDTRSSISAKSKVFKPQFVMLFNDSVMWTSESKRKRLKGVFLVENAELEYERLPEVGPGGGGVARTHCLVVRGFERLRLERVDLAFRFRSEEEHKRWKAALDECLEKAKGGGGGGGGGGGENLADNK